MSYATEDFKESLERSELHNAEILRVVAAWGMGDGQGSGDGMRPGWVEESRTDWNGGFLLALTDGQFAYLTGWCDYTGWGCQDGIALVYFDALPDRATLRTSADDLSGPMVPPEQWDDEPADLNRWLAR